MSKVNQIQNAIRGLGQGDFQKLADAYLHKKGYDRINSLGSVVGANKTRKGRPDTLIPLDNGKYVFAEYTTQQERVFEKLKDDLLGCFDEQDTGIPVEKIQTIVFCHTSEISAGELNSLAEECQRRNVNLDIFGISRISFDLYQYYPGLARDSLGVEVDTGQIVPLDEFIASYNKNKGATPLDTAFHFREKELDNILTSLEADNLVILSGRPGIGKSRLAIEGCRRFAEKHPEYQIRCIFNRGPDLFEDLRVHFSELKHYLIFVDDANRVSRFEYFVQLLQDQPESRQIKVITTVRDYAAGKVTDAARPCGNAPIINLQPLTSDQIRQLVKDLYGITNPHYLDRIAEIAKGNPRLAIMAARVAKEMNTLASIHDVSGLYDGYFSSILKHFEGLDSPNLLKAAGIVAFFRVIDRTQEDARNAIETVFGIPFDEFWAAVEHLHDLEMVDLYENEVVRTSDQVLATYLFYLAFFKNKVLSLSPLINEFFPRLSNRIVDALYPVINAFNSEAVIRALRPSIDAVWTKTIQAGDQKAMFQLIETFWFAKETDALIYVRDQIGQMQPESIASSEITFEPDSYVPSSSVLSVLANFRNSDDNNLRIALGLMCDYLEKRPAEVPKLLHIATKELGFRPDSHVWGFRVQRMVVEVLGERTKAGGDTLFSKVFLQIAEQYLHTHFEFTWPMEGHTIKWTQFDLPALPSIFELRKLIWSRVFELHRVPAIQGGVLDLLLAHSKSGGLQVSVHEIVAKDAPDVLAFLQSQLRPERYRHCVVVQAYLDLLKRHGVTFDEGLRNKFTNDAYALFELLRDDWGEKRELELSIDEYERLKKQRIREHFQAHDVSGYIRFFDSCAEIRSGLEQKAQDYQLQSGIVEVLQALAARNPVLYRGVLEHYLTLGDPFEIHPFLSVQSLVSACGSEKAGKLLTVSEWHSKRKWIFAFFQSLPAQEITADHVRQLCENYEAAEFRDIPRDWDFLLNYRQQEPKLVVRVAEILLRKTQHDPVFGHTFSMLFNPHTQTSKLMGDLYADDVAMLKQAYLAFLQADIHGDYDGHVFNYLLDRDPDFIREYVNWRYRDQELPGRHDESRNYTFLWKRDDFLKLGVQLVEQIYDKEKERGHVWGWYLQAFFAIDKNTRATAHRTAREDELLRLLIDKRNSDQEFMQLVFGVVEEFEPQRRVQFVAHFLKHNKDFDDFKALPLEPSHSSWSGSAVPMLQGRVEFFESLLPLVNTVEFLQHKQHVERFIDGSRRSIEFEKKRDFIED